jgi:uncharacterized membrane protein
MGIPILSSIAKAVVSIFGGAESIIDEFVHSGEEKAEAKQKLKDLQNRMALAVLGYEADFIKEAGQTVRAEIMGKSWLQRNWRPILMMVFAFILFNNFVLVPYVAAFGAEVPLLDIPPGMWGLLTVGVGGYIASRGVEKWQMLRNTEPE